MDVSVILRLIDGVSGPGKKAAAALRSVVKAANDLKKITGSNKLTRDLKASQAVVRGMSSDVRQFSSAFRGAMDSARGLTKAMSGNGKGMLTADVRNMREMVKLQGQMARSQGRMTGGGHGRRNAIGMPLIGFGMGHPHLHTGARHAYDATADLDTERHLMNAAGFGAADRDKLIKAAQATTAAIPISTEAQNLHRIRELNYALGNRVQMSTEALPDVAKLMAVIQFAKGAEKAGAVGDQIMEAVKGAELKNYISDMPTFQRWLKFQGQSVLATGGLVQPTSMFQTMKYARSAVHGWSEDFFPIASELTQEMMTGKGGGSRGGAGVSLGNFKRMFVDATVAGKNIPELLRRGLIDPSHIGGSGRNKHLTAGAFYDDTLAATNPFEYMKKRILPAMAKDHVNLKDHAAIVKWMAGLGGTDIMKQLLALMVIQRDQIEARLDLYKQAMPYDAAYAESMQTLAQNVDALSKQSADMSASLFAPMAPLANRILKGMTGVATMVSQWAKGHGGLLETLLPAAMLGGGGLAAVLLKLVLGRAGGSLLGGTLGMFLGGMPGALLGGLAGGGLASIAGGIGSIAGPGALFAGMLGLAKLSQGIDLGKMLDASGVSGFAMKIQNAIKDAFNADGMAGVGALIMSGLLNGLQSQAQAVIAWATGIVANIKSAFNTGGLEGVGSYIISSLLSSLQSQAQAVLQWATDFVNKLRNLFNFSASPTITPNGGAAPGAIGDPSGSVVPIPQHYIAPPRSGGGMQHASLGGNTVHVTMTNNINGAQDPNAIVRAISEHFKSSVERHLSDGAFA